MHSCMQPSSATMPTTPNTTQTAKETIIETAIGNTHIHQRFHHPVTTPTTEHDSFSKPKAESGGFPLLQE